MQVTVMGFKTLSDMCLRTCPACFCETDGQRLAPAICPKPTRAFDAAEAGATAEYTVFANLSADTNHETASIWMRRVYLVQKAGDWHLMVEQDRFPLLSVDDVRDLMESAQDAGEAPCAWRTCSFSDCCCTYVFYADSRDRAKNN